MDERRFAEGETCNGVLRLLSNLCPHREHAATRK